jgi:uncharacterized protein YyaL (SSP411 family)
MGEPAAGGAAPRGNGNRLAGETSPYLLQHAGNPVDWYPWGPEALERARTEDRPILLSVGYAACHWCHVMAHESFEDPETAELMNRWFVNVKVDREERPDVDAIYMNALQAMTGQGGWPMTVFLTPEGEPFFAGTYFPDTDRVGMPSFRKILAAVAEAWQQRRDDVLKQGREVARHVAEQAGALTGVEGELDESVLRQAFEGIAQSFDPEWGGFASAPKFPQPMTLDFLLRCNLRGWPGALDMVRRTLERMAAGGIFDHLGGGFHRYSTDRHWLVPHFEKMLYDNAQLIRLYARTFQVTGDQRYAEVARRTAAYLLRDLRHPEGGFFSSQDADSEGVEGKFFVWSYGELSEVAGELVARWFGATPDGNWEGTNILWTPRPPEDVAERAGVPVDELARAVLAGRQELFERRETTRVHPGTDDKVLAAWNGLTISGLAEAGRALGEPAWIEAATRCARFVLGTMRGPGGRLARAWREGRLGGPGYLDDYACMAEACLTLYETTFDLAWLRTARELADAILELFADPEGGFFQTGADAERLVVRPKELFDNAVPAGSSVAADVLLRLGRLLGEERYESAALGALRAVQGLFARAPTGFGHALGVADFALSRVREVAIVGDPSAADTGALLAEVRGRFRPNQVVALAAPGDGGAAEVPLLADRPAVDGRATAYVCEHFACQLPVTEPAALAEQLG